MPQFDFRPGRLRLNHIQHISRRRIFYESSAQQVTQRCTTGFRRIMLMPRML
jgi:hypothetical protein